MSDRRCPGINPDEPYLRCERWADHDVKLARS
jgi:hypothetical protein